MSTADDEPSELSLRLVDALAKGDLPEFREAWLAMARISRVWRWRGVAVAARG